LVQHARSLLRDAQLAIDVSRSAMRGEAGSLRIGFGLSSLAVGLPEIIQEFRNRFPGIHISMRELSTLPQLKELEDRTLDIGLVRLPISVPEISTFPLFSDRLVLAVSRRRVKDLRGGLKSWSGEPFVLVARSASASLHDHILRTCHAAGFLPRIVQEVSELFTVLRFVQAGVGVALVPYSSKVMNVPGVRYLETGTSEVQWKVGVAVHTSSASDPAVRNFVAAVRQQLNAKTL
jgi:DNA-binding transcriptional LysR family regulator